MLLFLLLVLAVFLARVGSAATMCFFLFLLRLFCVGVANIYNLGELPFGCAFFHLFTFFLAGFLCLFLVCCFLAVARLDEYRRPGPCEHSHAFFACSSIVYWPTAPISTIHGHRYTPGLVCVSVASVHMCFWQYAHVARSCAWQRSSATCLAPFPCPNPQLCSPAPIRIH